MVGSPFRNASCLCAVIYSLCCLDVTLPLPESIALLSESMSPEYAPELEAEPTHHPPGLEVGEEEEESVVRGILSADLWKAHLRVSVCTRSCAA